MNVAATTGSHRHRGRKRALAAIGVIAIGLAGLTATVDAKGKPDSPPGKPANPGKPPAPPGNPDPPGLLVPLQLLSFNDYHGHLEANQPPPLGNPPGNLAVPENPNPGVPAGGGEYLSSLIKQLRQGQKYSLTVAAGDLINASPFLSGAFRDEPSVESLNAMGLVVSSVGNHEFDDGVAELLRMQHGGCHADGCFFPDEPYAGADFQWLAANTVNDATGDTPLPPYWVTRIESVKVGFIGMTLEDTDTLVAPSGIEGWSFLDEVETANSYVPELRAQGVEAIVVLLHEGGFPTGGFFNDCVGISGPIVNIARDLDPAIDVIITGHTHQPYNCQLADPDGNPRIVTSAASFGRVLTEVNLVLDKRTGDVRRDLSTSTNHPVLHSQLERDPAITAVIDKWQPLAQEVGSVVIGETQGPLTRALTAGNLEHRGKESTAVNNVADAQLWASQNAGLGTQIAFMNPGGVRSNLPAGDITYAVAFTHQPFSNILVAYDLTGAQIKTLLEQQCQSRHLHLGVSTGFTWQGTINWTSETACGGITITGMQLNGAEIDLGATYRVATNDFLADGGDRFTVLAQVPRSERVAYGTDLEALIDYFENQSPIPVPPTNRATVNPPPTPPSS